MKLSLEDSEGVIYTVWAPQRVNETLEIKESTHIRNNGLKSTKGNKYWSFNVVELY
jgi:hypothetical protein